MPLLAGSAKVDITPRSPNHLAGYASRDHPHESVHDALSLRALYVRGPAGDGLLVSADVIWFMEETIDRLLPVLEAEMGLPPTNALLCGTHTHSAPVPGGERASAEWLSVLAGQVVAAAALAKTRLTPARLRLGRGECGIGINRRELRPDGTVVLGRNADGPIDRELRVLAVEDADGRTIARLGSFACHGVVLGPGNYQVSGDWPGVAAAKIEAASPGAPFLFLQGGAGNVNSRVGPQDRFEPVEELAGEFADALADACERLEPLPADDTVAGAEHVIHLPRKQRAIDDGQGKTRPVRLRGLRMGAARIVGYPGEVFSQTTMAVKAASPHPCTLVASCAAGGSAGYVPVAEAYDTGGYEVRISPYAEGAETVLREGYLDLLKKL